MSLTYHSEHLAWQQRVNQEKTRATNFHKTTGNFFSATSRSTDAFPNANQDLVPHNYKSLNFNLAYTFGGTKPIRHAFIDSPIKNTNQDIETKARNAKSIETPEKKGKHSRRHIQKYVEELKNKIDEERSKRLLLEKKLKTIN